MQRQKEKHGYIALIAAVRCPIRRTTTKAVNPITRSDAAATGTEPWTAPSIISATKSSISWYCALSNAFQATLSQMSVALQKNWKANGKHRRMASHKSKRMNFRQSIADWTSLTAWLEAFMRISFQVCCPKSSTSPWWRNTRLSRTALRAKCRKFRRSWSKLKRPLPISGDFSFSGSNQEVIKFRE